LAGAIVGAAIAHYAAKAREQELLVKQDERRAAHRALAATQKTANRISRGPDARDYGELHNEWQDEVWAPARLIRSDDLNRRTRAELYVLWLGALGADGFMHWAALRGAADVEEWIEAWLRGEEPPPPHLPSHEEIGRLVQSRGTLTMDNLNELLIVEAAGGARAYSGAQTERN
jgi:hypothetical protein